MMTRRGLFGLAVAPAVPAPEDDLLDISVSDFCFLLFAHEYRRRTVRDAIEDMKRRKGHV